MFIFIKQLPLFEDVKIISIPIHIQHVTLTLKNLFNKLSRISTEQFWVARDQNSDCWLSAWCLSGRKLLCGDLALNTSSVSRKHVLCTAIVQIAGCIKNYF